MAEFSRGPARGPLRGPLRGLRVIELAAIGPVPLCATLFADMGADVVRVDRRQAVDLGLAVELEPRFNVVGRGRRSIAVDLKAEAGREVVGRLAAGADALIEGFRPGVLERLGLAPDRLLEANPRLVVGRMTGFGQDGPMAQAAGHDINYIALAGVLNGIGRAGEPPVPPLNLIGDYGGGAMFLAFGVLAALLEAKGSGKGQVVDVSMVEGAAYLMAPFYGLLAQGFWRDERGVNVLDGGAPWYGVYRTRDGQFMSVGAIEGRFYRELVEKLGLGGERLPDQHDPSGWPELRARFAGAFASRTRVEWEAAFAGSDACVAPVLSMGEAPRHPHNTARGVFVERDGVVQPAPAPRFSRTPGEVGRSPCRPGEHTDEVLRDWGYGADDIARLKAEGVVGVE